MIKERTKQGIKDKVDSGEFKESSCALVLKSAKELVAKHKAIYTNMSGFERDHYINNNGLMHLNHSIEIGEYIELCFAHKKHNKKGGKHFFKTDRQCIDFLLNGGL